MLRFALLLLLCLQGCAPAMLNKEERTFMAGLYGEIEQAADGI